MTDDKKRPPDPGDKGRVYDPALNPESPEFDRKKWQEADNDILEIAGVQIKDMIQAAAAARDVIQAAGRAISSAIGEIGLFKDSDEWQAFAEPLRKLERAAPIWMEIIDEYEALTPYLEEELKNPEYEGKTIAELMAAAEDADDRNETEFENSLFMQAWRAAQAARDAAEGNKLRTIARAGNTQRITQDRLAIPTETNYINALNLLERGNAYITNVAMDGLVFNDGKLYFSDARARAISEMELQDLKTKEGIENINLPFLQFYYTILFKEWEKSIHEQAMGNDGKIDPITKFYMPELARARGIGANTSPESVEAIKKDIAAFHNVVGVLNEGYRNPSYYPVLNFEGYDSTTNTISISSPYLLHVVGKIYKASVRRAKDGTPKLKNNGTPQTKPVNSYLVHSDIQKERNRAAVQSVIIIVQGLEQRGGKENTEYRISAKSLINRNPLLRKQLENNKNKRRVLQRHFKKTLELLQSKTDLVTVYKNIKLPDPNNPKSIPTEKGIDDFIIRITHDGKAR